MVSIKFKVFFCFLFFLLVHTFSLPSLLAEEWGFEQIREELRYLKEKTARLAENQQNILEKQDSILQEVKRARVWARHQ